MKVFAIESEYTKLLFCPTCQIVMEPGSPERPVDYYETVKRFRANMLGFGHKDDSIDAIILKADQLPNLAEKIRYINSQQQRFRGVGKGGGWYVPASTLTPLGWLGFKAGEAITRVPLFASLTDGKRVWLERRIRLKYGKRCCRCGFRVSPDTRFCFECGTIQSSEEVTAV